MWGSPFSATSCNGNLDPGRPKGHTAPVTTDLPPPETVDVERIERFEDHDLHALCEAATAAILDGGGFGWVKPPAPHALERYFRGVVLVPDRELFVVRMDGTIYGAVQFVRPPRNNEAQAFSATMMHHFIAPYARGHGLARQLVVRVEERARGMGYQVLNLDVRDTQASAMRLYEQLGFIRWGTHPAYARVAGRTIAGHFYYKLLQRPEVVPS
jgi:RimJ/RimL family protein N-acetyltransferase